MRSLKQRSAERAIRSPQAPYSGEGKLPLSKIDQKPHPQPHMESLLHKFRD